MTWKMWIDDDAGKPGIGSWRNPPDDSWEVAHSSQEAIDLVDRLGIPCYIDFDHDLGLKQDGSEDTTMIFLKWFAYAHVDAADSFEYQVHSKNFSGAENIISFIESWKKSKEL